MRTIALILSGIILPLVYLATKDNQIPKKVECEVERHSPATVKKDYLNMCMR